MKITNAQRAEVLVHALPYIRKYKNKIIVVKYGGNAMINEELKDSVMRDIVLLSLMDIKVVLVHGGGPEITEMFARVGKKTEFINGLRVTDKESVELVQMVLAGKINKNLVNLLSVQGGKAVGLSGIDGRMLEAQMKDPALGFVGEITEIHPEIITDMLDKGYIPVISTVACDKEGNSYNVNADTAAAKIAGALGAECLISMTDITGIMRDKENTDSLISTLYVSDTQELVTEGVISGGMIPKVECCTEAIRRGVKKVFVIDGRVPHSLLIETLTDEGMGTMLVSGDGFSEEK